MQIQDEEQVQEVENGARPGDLLEIAECRETETLYLNGELATTKALQLFLNEISRERLLTRAEEAASLAASNAAIARHASG